MIGFLATGILLLKNNKAYVLTFKISAQVLVDLFFSKLAIYCKHKLSNWRTEMANQRGREWMGADKNSSRRRWILQQDEHGFQHTSPTHYPSWPSPRSHWSATEPRNQLPTSQTRERSGTPKLESTDQHGLDRWAPPERPVPAGETWRLPQNGSSPVRPVQHTG
jgi:hypothetical protein